jgi:hypothetical protein
VLRHRVPHYTLCPLGEPEIAIGHEPPIEPWLPFKNQFLLASFKARWAWSPPEDQAVRGRANRTEKTFERIEGTIGSGLDLETKIFSPSGRGRSFFLTSLFIELIEGF